MTWVIIVGDELAKVDSELAMNGHVVTIDGHVVTIDGHGATCVMRRGIFVVLPAI